ncbi:MAG: PQQ-binding-like beta-propeller repeat protein [Phycisphaerae bacterium]|nr:PQQ-binding-like beta-propeller repeat protein [Phycisphaerae bacterium]
MKRWIIASTLIALLLAATNAWSGPWAQFRGPNRNGQSSETGLLKSWPGDGPKQLWISEVDMGVGYSSPAVTKDAIYVTGVFDADGYVIALDLDGKSKWKTKYGREYTKNFLSARTTPTVSDGRLYVMSGLGRVVCLDAEKGDEKWAVDTVKQYGAKQVMWGMAECLLVCDDKVICTPGGAKAAIVALDKNTGKKIWTCSVKDNLSAYCSPIRIKDDSRDLIVTMLSQYVVGVSTKTGKLLWRYPYSGPHTVHANSPIYSDGQIYVTCGYNYGGVMLALAADGATVKKLWSAAKFDTHHGGAVKIGRRLYGSNWKSNTRGGWMCLDWKTGKITFQTSWSNKGSIVTAEGLLYCYTEAGTVALVKPSPTAWEVLSSFDVIKGSGRFWAHPAISGGRLYIRRGEALMAFDIKAPNTPESDLKTAGKQLTPRRRMSGLDRTGRSSGGMSGRATRRFAR